MRKSNEIQERLSAADFSQLRRAFDNFAHQDGSESGAHAKNNGSDRGQTRNGLDAEAKQEAVPGMGKPYGNHISHRRPSSGVWPSDSRSSKKHHNITGQGGFYNVLEIISATVATALVTTLIIRFMI